MHSTPVEYRIWMFDQSQALAVAVHQFSRNPAKNRLEYSIRCIPHLPHIDYRCTINRTRWPLQSINFRASANRRREVPPCQWRIRDESRGFRTRRIRQLSACKIELFDESHRSTRSQAAKINYHGRTGVCVNFQPVHFETAGNGMDFERIFDNAACQGIGICSASAHET